MQPVRIKIYGLVSLTRRSYLLQLGLALSLLVILLILSVALQMRRAALRSVAGPEERSRATDRQEPSNPYDERPAAALADRFLVYLPWVLGGIALLQGIEALVVLRRFARQEALRRQPLLGSHEPPAVPNSEP